MDGGAQLEALALENLSAIGRCWAVRFLPARILTTKQPHEVVARCYFVPVVVIVPKGRVNGVFMWWQ